MIKKRLIAVACAALLLLCTACSQSTERLTEEGRTTAQLYLDFVGKLQSGTLTSTHIGRDSWYDIATSEEVTIHLNIEADGTRRLLYRARTPFVFWYYPQYDYFDGTNYYFEYGDDWFINHSGGRIPTTQDLFLIQETFLNGNEIVTDTVYQSTSGYEMEATIRSPDRTRYYDITASCDLNFIFSRMDVRAYFYDYERQEYRLTDTYTYRFENINAGLPVVQPADLNRATVIERSTAPVQQ